MKHILTLFLLALALYPVQVGVELLWHYAFLDGVRFTVWSDWIRKITLLELAPVVILYFGIGWLYWRRNKHATPMHCFVFAVAVFAWLILFREKTWYPAPTLPDLVWHSIERLAPSVSVLLGAAIANLVANRSLNSDAGKAGAG